MATVRAIEGKWPARYTAVLFLAFYDLNDGPSTRKMPTVFFSSTDGMSVMSVVPRATR